MSEVWIPRQTGGKTQLCTMYLDKKILSQPSGRGNKSFVARNVFCIDVFGPLRVQSIGEKKYFVTDKDAIPPYKMVRVMKAKLDGLREFLRVRRHSSANMVEILSCCILTMVENIFLSKTTYIKRVSNWITVLPTPEHISVAVRVSLLLLWSS